MKNKKLLYGILGTLILSTASVYAFFTLTISKDFKFNHKLHIETAGIECSNCHASAKDGGIMGYPTHETCASCHEIDNQNTCNFCHLNNNKFKSFRTEKAFPNLVFTHEKHEQKGIKCLECHVNLNKKISLHANEGMPDMETCLGCHQNKKAPGKQNCAFCHPSSITEEKPHSHSPLWVRQHGSYFTNDKKIKECKYCHNSVIQQDCVECHKTEKPGSHTITFENRKHAQISMLDRQRCLTCHEQQTCITCHQNTRPFSHTGMYGSPYNRHCNNCHIGGNAADTTSSGSNCFFCHSTAIANFKHVSNSVLPVGHAKQNCLGCHRFGGGANIPAMKHPAGATDSSCMQCHR